MTKPSLYELAFLFATGALVVAFIWSVGDLWVALQW
jgi:hypothetical protein